jgi:hypothetical protein
MSTAYGPPMVRATIPHLTPSISNENMVVWKHAHESNGAAMLLIYKPIGRVAVEFQKADGRECRASDTPQPSYIVN